VKLAVHGVTGRMGQNVVKLAQASGDVEVVGGACAGSDPGEGRDIGELAGIGALGVVATADVASALLGADVVIDFSTASAVPNLLALAARNKVAVVSGTTNLDAQGKHALGRAAESVPVLWAANMSLGIQVLAELVEHALRRLGPAFDAEIVEIHHKKKVDAPSGTAKRLMEAVRAVRGDLTELHGRDGEVGARREREVGVFGVRGGDVAGDHTVFLLGSGERLELTHRAGSRELFAHGALVAARWLRQKPPALYTIADVLC
jgi:4-hydroxy-tetrahydrodipicolinate reductase